MKRRDFITMGGLSAAGFTLNRSNTDEKSRNIIPAPEGHIREESRDIPVEGEYDVVVCGGGPAGISAALMTGRLGLKTLLIDSAGCLGGTWTAGLLPVILDYKNKGGILKEIMDRLTRKGARDKAHPTNFDIEAMKLLLENLCTRAGVDILLHTRVVDVRKSGDRITHVLTESKSFREAWQGKIIIDTTGDGDVGALAGCAFDLGRGEDKRTQPMSMLGLVSGIRFSDYWKDNEKIWVARQGLRELIRKGGVDPSYRNPILFYIRENLFSLMANHEYGVHGTSSRDLTRATLNARQELNDMVNALRSNGGPWKNIRIVATPEHIGVREGRRIRGLYTVTKEDLEKGARFDDAVVRVKFGVDVHNLENDDETPNSRNFKSQPYDIPLRSLIAGDVDNLLMAGRCISGDFIAHSSYRVTGNAVPLGEAAGKLAVAAVQTKQLPKQVSWNTFRAIGDSIQAYNNVIN